jgi:Ohr subfamily peroxiredoxin
MQSSLRQWGNRLFERQGGERVPTVSATAVGGGKGVVRSRDGQLSMIFAPLPSSDIDTNPRGIAPENIFACAYAACFGALVEGFVRQQDAVPERVEVTATVGMEKALLSCLGHGPSLDVELDVRLRGVSRGIAAAAVADAHRHCPYSIAMRGNVAVRLYLCP